MTNEPKHTQGPWNWNETHCLIDSPAAYDDGKQYVTDLSSNINKADAYLIASAPELLEAAKEVREMVSAVCHCHDEPLTPGRCDFCVAGRILSKAISKAEGR